jgi:hypothetical protein
LTGQDLSREEIREGLFPQEDPESFFETKLGDADVELFLEGFWESSIKGSLGAAIIPGQGFLYPYLFPGFIDGLIFEQKPDLTLSLWLMKRYYFETEFGEDYRMNTYLLGYQGAEGEFLQSVKAGNKDIEISPFRYMDFSGSSLRSPGIAAMFQTGKARHEFLLRYDPSLPLSKIFIGKNEVDERRIDPAAYAPGRFFVLPDPEADFLSVYFEDARGTVPGADGRRYRRAADHEISYSLREGTLTLVKKALGRVVVYYEKGGRPVGHPDLGIGALPDYRQASPSAPIQLDPRGIPRDFSWTAPDYMNKPLLRYKVPLENREGLLVYEPESFSPFEIQGSYSYEGFSLPPGGAWTLRISKRGTSGIYTPSNTLALVSDETNTVVRVLPEDGIRSMLARYPFADDEPLLYGPDRHKGEGYADFEILLQSYTPVQSYSLGNDVLPGSVRILRNGREESLFTVDYETGIVSLPFEPAPSDRIEIFYRATAGEGQGGDILFGSGSTIALRENLILRLAAGLRWNVLKGSYSTEPGDHPGLVGASAEINYKQENLSLSADGAMVYTNPDTSGLLRLLSMEKHEIILEITKNNLFPSSVPHPSFFAGALTSENRGRLFFKNFESRDMLGTLILNPYTWEPPASQIFPYETGSKPGPYIAAAVSEGADRIMVMDYELGAGESWVGAQMNLATGPDGRIDLSKVTAIRFAYKTVALSGAPMSLHLHTGAVDEDLDGDGRLDEETGSGSRGYEFNQGTLILYVGGGQEGLGNAVKDSEDGNRNGVLDRENPDLLFPPPGESSHGYVISAPGGWKTGLVRIPGPDRNRLANVRSVRIVLKKEGTGVSVGKVLVGKIVFEGSSLAYRVDGEGTLRLREIVETLSDIPAPVPLHRAHNDVLDIFHGEGEGGEPKVLEALWYGLGSGESWEIKAFTPEVPPKDYKRLNIFLRTAALEVPEAVLDLSYTDAEGKGINLSFPVTADNIWEKLSIDIPGRRAYLGEKELARPSIDSSYGKLIRFTLSLSGSPSGTIYLDELYLSDPADAFGFAGSLDLSFVLPGTLISVGGFPLLRNLAVSEKITARTPDFQARTDKDTEPGYFTSAGSVSGEVFGLVLADGEFAFNVLGTKIEYEGGHAVRLPAEGGAVVLKEQFKRNFHAPDPSLSRANRLEVTPLEGLVLEAGTESSLSSGVLSQRWETQGRLARTRLPSISAYASLENKAEGYGIENDSYPDSWISAYSLFSPWTEGIRPERRGLARMDTEFSPAPLGFRLRPEITYTNTGAADGRQRNTGSLDLEIPFLYKRNEFDPGWSITFLYGRKTDTLTGVPIRGDFRSDMETLGETLENQRYMYTSVPLLEIFSPFSASGFAGDTAGLLQGEYTPKAGVRYSRAYGSLIFDLLVPSRIEGGVKKTMTRGGDSLSAANTWDLSFTNFALNLFGADGSYPIFPWYGSDEFQIQNTFSLLTREGAADKDWSVTTNQTAGFYGLSDNKLILDHTLTVEDKDTFQYRGTGSAKYLWRSEMVRDFGIGLMGKAREGGAYYNHTEKLEFTYDGKDGFKTFIIAGHETALTLKKYGFIKAELNMGFGIERDYSGLPPGYRLIFGLQGGLTAHFKF